MLSEKRRAEEEGTAAAWALLYMRFGAETATESVRAFKGSKTALERIKRRMWQHIEANRRATKGGGRT